MRSLHKFNRIVIKIGSNILTDSDKVINENRIEQIAKAIFELKKTVSEVLIVSSGAVAAGFKLLGFQKRPTNIIDKQACASAGQARLMLYYEQAFAKYNIRPAQILLTKYDFSNRKGYINSRAVINRLLDLGAVPIINENDTVSANGVKYIETFGDNDNLSALVAVMISADILLILSDVDGLYSDDPSINPDAKLISDVNNINDDIISLAGSSISGVGTGGMQSKLIAANKALMAGCYVGIINGKNPNNILDFLTGKDIGTFFSNPYIDIDKKKLWFAHATIPHGAVIIDYGAEEAIIDRGSLLASGIIDVNGFFLAGDIVDIINYDGRRIGSGKVRYSSQDLHRIKKRKSSEVSTLLGKKGAAIVIHSNEIGFSD